MEFNTVSKGAVYARQVSKALKFHNIGFNKPHKCPFPGTFIPIFIIFLKKWSLQFCPTASCLNVTKTAQIKSYLLMPVHPRDPFQNIVF